MEWSIEAFRGAAGVRSIVVACPPGHVHDLGGHDLAVVDGGETRAVSVANALAAVGTELVAIHDAARPLVTAELIEGVVATLAAEPAADGAIAASPLTDTVKRAAAPASDGGEGEALSRATEPTFPTDSVGKVRLVVAETVDRGRLWGAQTPQVFRTEALRRALEAAPQAAESATDEAMLIEAAGGRVLIHPAPPENLKVTVPHDLRFAELLLAERGAEASGR